MDLNKSIETERTKVFYNKLAEDHGTRSVRVLGWVSRFTQCARFRALVGVLPSLDNCSILDVGTGHGDLLQFLLDSGVSIKKFHGVDICESMIKVANEKYGGSFGESYIVDASFSIGNWLANGSSEADAHGPYDVVFASGVLSLSGALQGEHWKDNIRKLFLGCSRGLAFNMLSMHLSEELKEDDFIYFDPCEVLAFCMTLTKYCSLVHTYLEGDFTVFMYPSMPLSVESSVPVSKPMTRKRKSLVYSA